MNEISEATHEPTPVLTALWDRLGQFAQLGTQGYPRAVRRRLAAVNVMAYLIAIFSLLYAGLFAVYDVEAYLSLVVANLLLVGIALLAPLAHRVSDTAAAILIAVAEYVALFLFVRTLGRDSGIQLNYLIAAAVPFLVLGPRHKALVVLAIGGGVVLHLAAWFLYPSERAQVSPDAALLANLYVSSAVTTMGIIALIVGYAFTTAEQARAETRSLLAKILPETVVERLRTQPGQLIADSVEKAAVLFTDLVGFTPMAHRLGAERTVSLLDSIVTEFDRLAVEHGVEKIKTIGDGYMAVSGITGGAGDHEVRLARLSLALMKAVERLASEHGESLSIRAGIASGPAMAGVIGRDKFSYDVWGETVNLAARLESHGVPGAVHVTREVHESLGDTFACEPRGSVDIKGVGRMETWLLRPGA